MLIKNKQLKKLDEEPLLHPEHTKWCETNTHNIYLRYDTKTDEIYFVRCCHKQNEKVYKLSLNEFDSLTIPDIKNILKKINTEPLKDHDFSVFPCCRSSKSVCDYRNDVVDSIVVGFLYKCNMNCRMCTILKSITKDVDERVKNAYFNFLNKIKDIKLSRITLTEQGEPFFYKKETMDFISSLSYENCKQLTIITNCLNLNENDIKFIAEVKQRTNIDIQVIASCSAITEETYKQVHKNNNFNKVVDNILSFKKYNLLLCVNFVVQKTNLHELEFLYDFWYSKDKSFNKYDVATCVITPPGKYFDEDKFVLNSEEFKKYKLGSTW